MEGMVIVKLVELLKVENSVIAAMLCGIDVIIIDVNAVSEGCVLPEIDSSHVIYLSFVSFCEYYSTEIDRSQVKLKLSKIAKLWQRTII